MKSFGQVVVTAGGTPVRATSNQSDPTKRVGLQSLTVQVRPANTGLLYIRMGNSPLDDRTTRSTVLAILPAPASATSGPFASVTFSIPVAPAGLNLADIYLDASVNGDGGILSGTVG